MLLLTGWWTSESSEGAAALRVAEVRLEATLALALDAVFLPALMATSRIMPFSGSFRDSQERFFFLERRARGACTRFVFLAGARSVFILLL